MVLHEEFQSGWLVMKGGGNLTGFPAFGNELVDGSVKADGT